MNIACATDDRYVQHCGVMLTSLFENNIGENIHIYLLTAGLTDEHRTSLENIVKHYKGYFHYCRIDEENMKDFPQGGVANSHITLAAYNRLFLPLFLPQNEERVIYLDCDMVVCSSLRELWLTDITEYAVGAVKECWWNSQKHCERLGYDSRYSYFNSGLLLINLVYWRKYELMDKLFDYIRQHSEHLLFHDQDALNAVLKDCWYELPFKWNVLTDAFYTEMEHLTLPDYIVSVKQAIYYPCVIHFLCKPKPWEAACWHPYRKEYFKYLSLTEWRNFIPPVSLYKSLRHWGAGLLSILKLRKKKMLNEADIGRHKIR